MDNQPQHIAVLLLTIEEAAQALSLSRSVMYRLVLANEVLSVKIGNLRRIPVVALHRYVDKLLASSQEAVA